MFARTPRPVTRPAYITPVPTVASRNAYRVTPSHLSVAARWFGEGASSPDRGAKRRDCRSVFPGNRGPLFLALVTLCLAVWANPLLQSQAHSAPDRPFNATSQSAGISSPAAANFGLGPVGGPSPGATLLGRPLDRLPLNPLPHPAVVRVVAQERNAESHGSGTLIDVREDCGLVVTNWHVVRDAVGKIEVRFPGGFVSPARVRKADKVWDLAALVIWRPPVEPVRISRQPPRRGEPLTIAGYGPGPYRAVAGRCTQYVSPGVNYPPEMVELSAEARQGDSGGPIFNDQGELAGVLFGAARGTTTGSYGGRVREFLASIVTDPGVTPTPNAGTVAGITAAANPNASFSGVGDQAASAPMSQPNPFSPPPLTPPPFTPPQMSPPQFASPLDANSMGSSNGAAVGRSGANPVTPAVALGQPLSEHAPYSPLNAGLNSPPNAFSTGAPNTAPQGTHLAIPDPAAHPLQLPPPPPDAVASTFSELSSGSNASMRRSPPALPIMPMPPPPRDAAEPAVDSEIADRVTWAASPFKLRESPGTSSTSSQSASPAPSTQTLEQWLALDGAPADQAKTVLALVGALALLAQAGRLLQSSEPAPKAKT